MKKNFKKLVGLVLGTAMMMSVIGCSQTGGEVEETEEKPEVVTIKTLNGNKEEIDLEVPYDAGRIAILDMASLDIIDNLGLGDRVVGTASTSIDYLASYAENEEVKNLGTIKEADLEAVMECEPDVIFIGGRLAASYDDLSEIAPVVFLATDADLGVVASVAKNATTVASMFGLESQVEEKVAAFDERVSALSEVAKGKTALVGLTTSGSLNLLPNSGRCSVIGVEIGFENLTAEESEEETASHGNESSFEVVVEQNPDYIRSEERRVGKEC